MLDKIYITEEPNFTKETRWILSFDRPEFQGGASIDIDEKTAKEILKIKNNKSPSGVSWDSSTGRAVQKSIGVGIKNFSH